MTERYSVAMNSDSQEDGYLLLDSRIIDGHIVAVFEPAFEDLARRIAGMLNAAQTWDFSVGQDYIRIEWVKGEEVLGLVAEIPISLGAEDIALAVCNAHNGGLSA